MTSPRTLQLFRQAIERPGIQIGGDLPATSAGVAIVHRLHEGQIEILFIERVKSPRDPWSGQMGFPGGMPDSTDRDSRSTAERETHEELGVTLSKQASYIGLLNSIQARNRLGLQPFKVDTHLFLLKESISPTPDPREVAATSWVSLDFLTRQENLTFLTAEFNGAQISRPGIKLDQRVIWGLSYVMVLDWIARLGDTSPQTLLAIEDPRTSVSPEIVAAIRQINQNCRSVFELTD